MMAQTMFASFVSKDDAERATGALLDHGLKNEDVSLVAGGTEEDAKTWRTRAELRDPVRRGDADDDDDDDLSAKSGISTTTTEDAGAAAMAGAGIGAGLGALAALGTLFIPGVGLVVGGGALATALAGAAGATAAGAVAGGATGYLVDMGVDADTAKSYDEAVRGGGAVLGISLPSGDISEADVREILTKYNATNITGSAAAL